MATYVVIPGAGDVPENWALVAAELRERGQELMAVELPGDDESPAFADGVEAAVAAIGDRSDLVVVGHSLGGFVAPLVCERVPVDELVLVAGMIPRPGETGSEWWTNTGHGDAVREQYERDPSPIAVYLHDVPTELAQAALARERDDVGVPMDEPWPLDAWPDVPTRYVLCRDDRFFPADWSRRVVRDRLGIEPEEIDGGHCPFLSRPGELVDVLLRNRASLA